MDGTVELPRTTYDRLVDAARTPVDVPRPAPVPWVLGLGADHGAHLGLAEHPRHRRGPRDVHRRARR
ncbi:MAG: hypothetical protein AAFY88_18645, partial [Acidobacteriota bacterium]